MIDQTDGTGNGGYMIVDISQSSLVTINQRARLMSPIINPNGEQCIEFWYYSDADIPSSPSRLTVFIRANPQAKNESNYLIWSKNIVQVSYCCWFFLYKGKTFAFSRNVNGVFHNNVFHMVLVQHHIKLFSKAQFLNQVPIHQSLLLMMFLFVIELVLNLEIVILKMGNSSQQKKLFSL